MLLFQESIPLTEGPSSGEPAETEPTPTPEEPMETITVLLTKKKGEIGITRSVY